MMEVKFDFVDCNDRLPEPFAVVWMFIYTTDSDQTLTLGFIDSTNDCWRSLAHNFIKFKKSDIRFWAEFNDDFPEQAKPSVQFVKHNP